MRYIALLLVLNYGLRAELAGNDLESYLLEGKFGPELASPDTATSAPGSYISFTSTGTNNYEIIGWPGGVEATGTYKIKGKKVVLEGGKTCVLNQKSRSLVVTDELKCGSTIYYNVRTRRPEGDEVTIRGQKSVLMGAKDGKLTTAAVYRVKPSIKAASIVCDHEGAVGSRSPLVNGFTVIARTKDKVKVNKWENYWYYVSVPDDESRSCRASTGWVFAEFVEVR